MKKVRLFVWLSAGFTVIHAVIYFLFHKSFWFPILDGFLAGFGIVWLAWAITQYFEIKEYWEDAE